MNARVRRAAVVVLALLAAAGLVGCSDDIADQSLCTAYDEYVAVRAQVREIDAQSQTAADAEDLARDYLHAVQRLQQAAANENGRFRTQLTNLEAAANDVLLTLSSVQDDASYDTWAPLVQDDLEDAADAAAALDEQITQCTTAVVAE